ncbi:PIN domain-containing protein [Helicobacter cynogastricus]|uniref:NYN domain-containing protein n=1 Tax=Helicobacter cynogastricus TaxID=329937 RepID=UPI000CF0B832|nr:NYN domain-containing protein [Helicobacter cynogastricus]
MCYPHLQDHPVPTNLAKSVKDLIDGDFQLDLRQKMVGMKISLDIASLAIKKQVKKIILIANDNDFVSTIKFAK